MFVPVERYISPEFFHLERTKVWDRTWQMACREEHLPNVGDYVVYDVAGRSYLVVRSDPSTIKAFHNVCLHRGRLLRDEGGCRATEFRCPFHGFGWNIDGSLKQIPCAWDFPQVEDPADWSLRAVQVGTWGGFVFINPDPTAPSLESYVGELGEHFARWPLEDRFVQVHVAKILRCNWKVAQEAFMEAMHVVATHPQLLASIGDANSQYDVFGNFSRAITANGTPSPHLRWEPTEQEMLDSMYDRNLDEPPVLTVPEGRTARDVAAESRRNQLRPVLGAAAETLSDAEVNDSFYFTLFPNFHPWGAFNRIVYRFRPNGMNVDEAIMECMFLSPFPPGERPPPAPIHWLDADSDWTKAPAAGSAGPASSTRTRSTCPNVHLGLRASPLPARHVRPLRGVEDPPLAHAPRGAPRPTVSASLEERQAIVDVVVQYATGIDRRDWALYERCFTDPCEIDFSSWTRATGGDASRRRTGSPGCARRTATSTPRSTCRRTTSSRSSLRTRRRASARCRPSTGSAPSDCSAWAIRPTSRGGARSAATTPTDLVRTDAGWRIARCELTVTWVTGDRSVFDIARSLGDPARAPRTTGSSPRK